MKRFFNMVMVVCFVLLPLIGCGKNSDYKRGTLTENSFESKYLDIKFTLPDNFILSTEEDMLQMMGISTDIIGVKGVNKEIIKLTTVYEMMASTITGYPNVILMMEKPILSNITIEQYFGALKTNLLGFNNMDYVIDDEITSVEIAGYDYKQMTASLPSLNVFQNYIFRKQDGRMIGFITTYLSDTKQELDRLMGGFSKLKK
jgi:hypothetical protein